jgi:hypothetical protein
MSKNMLGNLSLHQIRGPRDQLEDCLAGENGLEWLVALKKFLRREPCWVEPTFSIWRNVWVGVGPRDESAFVDALDKHSCRSSEESRAAIYALGQDCDLQTRPKKLYKLVLVSVSELGFPDGAIRKDIYDRAEKLGLLQP